MTHARESPRKSVLLELSSSSNICQGQLLYLLAIGTEIKQKAGFCESCLGVMPIRHGRFTSRILQAPKKLFVVVMSGIGLAFQTMVTTQRGKSPRTMDSCPITRFPRGVCVQPRVAIISFMRPLSTHKALSSIEESGRWSTLRYSPFACLSCAHCSFIS